MHYSDFIKEYAVSYSCKVVDEKGNFIGVLSTRFNWSYIYDIIEKAKISEAGDVFLVNKSGMVIASRDRQGILKKNILETYPEINELLKKEEYGYAIELGNNDNLKRVLGYAHTRGYNNYPGKDWSVVVIEQVL